MDAVAFVATLLAVQPTWIVVTGTTHTCRWLADAIRQWWPASPGSIP